ncbi:MAG: hypothetical protein LBJ61_03650 [Deltaproteobacteria bacterium]|nr:hypothetical protein [Deltaproteobacteria bacterium]
MSSKKKFRPSPAKLAGAPTKVTGPSPLVPIGPGAEGKAEVVSLGPGPNRPGHPETAQGPERLEATKRPERAEGPDLAMLTDGLEGEELAELMELASAMEALIWKKTGGPEEADWQLDGLTEEERRPLLIRRAAEAEERALANPGEPIGIDWDLAKHMGCFIEDAVSPQDFQEPRKGARHGRVPAAAPAESDGR